MNSLDVLGTQLSRWGEDVIQKISEHPMYAQAPLQSCPLEDPIVEMAFARLEVGDYVAATGLSNAELNGKSCETRGSKGDRVMAQFFHERDVKLSKVANLKACLSSGASGGASGASAPTSTSSSEQASAVARSR